MIFRGRRYVLSPYSFRWAPHEFNDAGRAILAYVTASSVDVTFEQLVAHLSGIYDAKTDALARDAVEFMDECIARDYLVNADQDAESDALVREIQAAQRYIPSLTLSHFGFEVRLGDRLTPGCASCSRGTWAVFNVGVQCNLTCTFCPYVATPQRQQADAADDSSSGLTLSFAGTRFRAARDLKLQFDLVHDHYDGIAWVGGEPMMPGTFEELLSLIRYFHETYPSYHQWLYTNGTYANATRMEALRTAGIRELRFNLAATGFNRRVIARMAQARKIFDFVCLEIPMTREAHHDLMAHADEILDTQLDQMNLAEYIVGEQHLANSAALESEGRLYVYRGFICSPTRSRWYTYDVIRRAARECWPVVINDCSNEYKYYKLSKGLQGRRVFDGFVSYWNNTYSLADVDRFNDRLGEPFVARPSLGLSR